MSDDGSRLRISWAAALSGAKAQFRSLLLSSNSPSWKRVPLLPATTTQMNSNSMAISSPKGKGRVVTADSLVVHRQHTKHGDVLRVVLDVPLESATADLDKWRAVLSTPEIRKDWDPAVEDSSLVEMFDWNTRVTRTNYALGWPANPRDAVTISQTLHDASTLIDISTSLPRSPDEPAYLRPAPPYVRSHVHLFALCIQILSRPTNDESSQPTPSFNRIRITCFWQHDLKSMWSLSSSLSQQLPAMVRGLVHIVRTRGDRLPLLSAYGNGVSLERVVFDVGREALDVEYAIVHEGDDESTNHAVKALEEVNELKERKRLERSIEYILPDSIGWDVRISTRASSDEIASLPWNAHANRTSGTAHGGNNTTFRVRHSSLPDTQSVLKVKMTIELSGGPSGLRLNGLPHPVLDSEVRDPTSFTLSRQMLQDASSVSGLSVHTQSTAGSNGDYSPAPSITPLQRSLSTKDGTSRGTVAEKSILTRVKRNYIYFSSLLQEPEAKWKRNSEARGVTVTQLDSIDPTLVVYRAEAVFVGVGLWDLYSTVASPGARVFWDKGFEDAVLLDDVNELTELWHWRTKPNWPANARDAVLLKTVYKSPTTIHVFSFSTDDTQLFSSIPLVDPNVIRTQVDLQGWVIEALSPTTTLLTLLEQSDPRGWTNKSSIPQQMINAVAGVGEFAIKNGGPPINTRLAFARILSARYDHEKGTFKMEYEGCEQRRAALGSGSYESKGNSVVDLTKSSSSSDSTPVPADLRYIECELRCDLDTWASSLEIVVDPPPQTATCLRRHKLSSDGGGLWLTIEHDAAFGVDDRLLIIVRRSTSKDKGAVVVNGSKIRVDVEELPDREVKALTKMKRIKPLRIPLDQPPVLGVIRRRRQEWGDMTKEDSSDSGNETGGKNGWAAAGPKLSSPLSKIWTMALEQTAATTSAAVNVASSVTFSSNLGVDAPLSSSKLPMTYALSALEFLRDLHGNPTTDGWAVVNDKGFAVYKKLYPQVSVAIPVHKGEKVIEGVSAEELAHVIVNYDCRASWDDRFDSATVLQEYGSGCHTAFVVSKGGFPFRDRGFYVASVLARLLTPSNSHSSLQQRNGTASPHRIPAAVFCAVSSFSPNSVDSFDATKYNPHGLPIGRIMVQGWILETLDPYTTENYAIPSTRCTHVVAVDYAGSVPVAYNAMINAAIPRSVLALEQFIKGRSALPVMRLPAGELGTAPVDDSKDVEEFVVSSKAWTLSIRDPKRMLISSNYHESSKTFKAILQMSPSMPHVDATTPRHRDLKSLPPPEVFATPDHSSTTIPPLQPSPAATIRERSTSAASNTFEPSSTSQEPSHAKAFSSTLNGDPSANPEDFLVGELVVDSKLYRDGYNIHVASKLRNSSQQSKPLSLAPIPPTSSDLPISCSCHILPPTPLHSSGLSIDSPPRHLLRFTLPTAQYEIPANEPLSLHPPTRPPWLVELEQGAAIVEIVITPSADGDNKGNPFVVVDGSAIPVVGEKDSMKLLRRELENGRFDNLAMLSRTISTSGGENLPVALAEPLAIASSLWNNSLLAEQVTSVAPSSDEGEKSDRDVLPADQGNSERKELASTNVETESASSTTSGLFKFLNGYPHIIFRRRSSNTSEVPSKSLSTYIAGSLPFNHNNSHASSIDLKTKSQDTRLYPLSTVLIIGLISFLFGSLMRSLLTPADFIYVSRDLSELEDDNGGWRELKRLVELKYAIGGWDFLIGVVRRH